MDNFSFADELISYAEKNLGLKKSNVIYVKNRLLEILGGIDGEPDSDDYDALYGALSLTPCEVNEKFQSLLKEDAKKATDWLYGYCVKNDYVKKAVLDKNPRFDSEGLVVTINKAKPEFRDPKKAVSGNSVAGGYPKCSICRENEGFAGRSKRTLRTVDLKLGGQNWFWQYSPYGYFNQHGIAVNCEHKPMHIDRETFARLLDFVDTFPHYFIGCNACLPRIGGSVLAHDHYQGGGEILPMHKAKAYVTMKNGKYPEAVLEVLDWKGTVVRVVSKNRESVVDIADKIREKWDSYTNEELGITAEDKEGIHNSVSPTVVKTDRGYEMSIILRSNITSETYPDGVFHAHPEFHVIKKESIGLIEAQGLFILPGRLEEQLEGLCEILESGKPLTDEMKEFELIYNETKEIYLADKKAGAWSAMKKELGSICNRILENTAVFKDKALTVNFVSDLGFKIV